MSKQAVRLALNESERPHLCSSSFGFEEELTLLSVAAVALSSIFLAASVQMQTDPSVEAEATTWPNSACAQHTFLR